MESLVMVFFFALLFRFSDAGTFTWLHSDATVNFVEGETAKLNWSVQITAGRTWLLVNITRSPNAGAGPGDVGLIRRKPSGVEILLSERASDMALDVQENSNVLNVTFTLRNLLRKTDEMYYRITVLDDDTDTSASDTKLNVDVPSSCEIHPNATTVNETDIVFMNVTTTGNPPVQVYHWTFPNGTRLTINNILTFSASRQDAGTYKVSVYNGIGGPSHCTSNVTVQYLDEIEVIGASNKSYSPSNPVVLFNLSVNAYPSNTTLTCNPSVPNVMTVINSHDAGLQTKHYLVVVIIEKVVDTANITCIADNSVGKREKTLFFYRQPLLFKEKIEAQYKITNQEWQSELKDPKTTEYKNLANKCIKTIKNAYNDLPYLAGVNIKEFLKGSVIVRFELEVIGQVSDPLLPLKDYVKRQGGEIDGLQIDYNSIQKSSEFKDDSLTPAAEHNKKVVTLLETMLALSIVLNFLAITIFLCRLRRKDSRGDYKNRSDESHEMGQTNDIALQETSLNNIPNVPEDEPIERQALAASNSGNPEYEAVTSRTQATQPQSVVETNNPMPQNKSADQDKVPGADSNTPSVTYQTIQPRTGDYESLSPSTRLPPKDTSTGSPTRTGEYETLNYKGSISL